MQNCFGRFVKVRIDMNIVISKWIVEAREFCDLLTEEW